MSQEIELKLALDHDGFAALPALPLLATGAEPRRSLVNTYFDTPEGDLERAKVALRIRQVGERCLQTLKTSGAGSGGLSQRGEWEWPIDGPDLDLVGLAALPPMRDLDAATLDALAPRFRTDFQRRTWQLKWHDSHIELALDRGEIVAGSRQAEICELELELKAGEVAALWQLAETLAEQVALRPAQTSKAARGAALGANQWTLPEDDTSPRACFDRSMAALDAYRDSHQPAFIETARDALARLAVNADDRDTQDLARRAAQGLDAHGRLDLAGGQAALALAQRLAD
ncbi:CYTH domain-containing protein [Franzmannia pantelleriensis]|uniref:CYTH domain-containing protein n=1 Tax=Franzmannia pantelleriensis TaxID=48727 RepID=A0A1G9Q5Y7_9GAMM|nr:CYTH domain-containing protein [Halomonas pantelleriensis]SDM06430.1 CYTH domain-containing protein [Halomonas pantelleriensis]